MVEPAHLQNMRKSNLINSKRWAPTSYKWSYNYNYNPIYNL